MLKLDIPDKSAVGKALIKPQYIFHHETAADSLVESSEPEAKKFKRSDKKKNRGQNKNRHEFNKKGASATGLKLCSILVDVLEEVPLPVCQYTGCKNLHDINQYLSSKLPDLGEICPVFEATGHCPRGVTCRFGSKHITEEGRNKIISSLIAKNEKPVSVLSKDLQMQLRKRNYNFSVANNAVAHVLGKDNSMGENAEEVPEQTELTGSKLGTICDADLLNKREKKQIDWKNKLYLSPLTTLGNLPFRRVCKEWGADITCGEMAMATPILQGVASEWALFRRHKSENLFGVQLCGNNPHVLARCAQLVEEVADVDFIDLNLGCPIEMVYQKGAGSGLLRREKHLDSVVRSMSLATSLPVTVKTRTGVYADKRVAHNLMPLFTAAGAALITVHGRSREQRYTRNADWDYIAECANLAAPTPVFGNGDILSYHDYNAMRSKHPHLAGVMIGRGALYKPWIFTEIKEQRDWDISSAERLEILRKFVHFGYEHWGTDARGVENTRRFLLEWLSFLYRYIPVGLLERPPQRINERPPRYLGRDDLETLMASPNCTDWVKISEMLCGPVPENFQFLPKHKANAWATD